MLDLVVIIGDLKNVFCPSNPLYRLRGWIFVGPCKGIPVPEGCLIELVAPVYGLDDSPLTLHETLSGFLSEHGYPKTCLEPCWFVNRRQGTDFLRAMILSEVDDLAPVHPKDAQDLQSLLTGRFTFGKFQMVDAQGAQYIGRRIRGLPDQFLVDQEKYILEQLAPLKLAKGRAADKSSPRNTQEKVAYRSLTYKVSWVARET